MLILLNSLLIDEFYAALILTVAAILFTVFQFKHWPKMKQDKRLFLLSATMIECAILITFII